LDEGPVSGAKVHPLQQVEQAPLEDIRGQMPLLWGKNGGTFLRCHAGFPISQGKWKFSLSAASRNRGRVPAFAVDAERDTGRTRGEGEAMTPAPPSTSLPSAYSTRHVSVSHAVSSEGPTGFPAKNTTHRCRDSPQDLRRAPRRRPLEVP